MCYSRNDNKQQKLHLYCFSVIIWISLTSIVTQFMFLEFWLPLFNMSYWLVSTRVKGKLLMCSPGVSTEENTQSQTNQLGTTMGSPIGLNRFPLVVCKCSLHFYWYLIDQCNKLETGICLHPEEKQHITQHIQLPPPNTNCLNNDFQGLSVERYRLQWLFKV